MSWSPTDSGAGVAGVADLVAVDVDDVDAGTLTRRVRQGRGRRDGDGSDGQRRDRHGGQRPRVHDAGHAGLLLLTDGGLPAPVAGTSRTPVTERLLAGNSPAAPVPGTAGTVAPRANGLPRTRSPGRYARRATPRDGRPEHHRAPVPLPPAAERGRADRSPRRGPLARRGAGAVAEGPAGLHLAAAQGARRRCPGDARARVPAARGRRRARRLAVRAARPGPAAGGAARGSG